MKSPDLYLSPDQKEDAMTDEQTKMRYEIGDTLMNFRILGLSIKEGEDRILALLAPTIEKAKKWDKVKAIAEVVVLAPCAECCKFSKPCSNLEADYDLCDACKLVVDALEGEKPWE